MKLRLLAAVVLSLAVFTGCGTKAETPAVEAGQTTEATEVKTAEVAKDKDKIVTEVTFQDGKPVDVQIDIIMEDGSSKYEKAAAGEYVMVEGAENTWDKQIDALEAFIKENNFDLAAVTVNEEGKTDAITGVSVSVPDLLEGLEQILTENK